MIILSANKQSVEKGQNIAFDTVISKYGNTEKYDNGYVTVNPGRYLVTFVGIINNMDVQVAKYIDISNYKERIKVKYNGDNTVIVSEAQLIITRVL